ncbi:MAG TPA: DUF3299 domain-containing protein [Cytophagales bacterium]|nr:DUF3299 domain-containing protein [Cytophagales bacterium]HAA17770.1 DUF3299 domain-containing protein [Cytophagales bacterium]HAP59854.1 DUF3299 domain-containing protein [Cytophagales bacterium]
MRSVFFLCFLLISVKGWSQTEITWETLTDVEFSRKYFEEVDGYMYYPHFGETVKALEGEEVYLKGYMLPIDPKEGIFVLSRSPFASCFFCGNAGPETIVELLLKPDYPRFKMDQVVTMKGRLKLNQDDIDYCNYILEDAELHIKW